MRILRAWPLALLGCPAEPPTVDPYCSTDPAACVPPTLPPDTGPVLDFQGPLQGVLPTDGGPALPLLLAPVADGLLLVADAPAQAQVLDCARDRNTLDCPATGLGAAGGWLHLDRLQIRLSDADADGVADHGQLRAEGRWSLGPQEQPILTLISLLPDTQGGHLFLPVDRLPTDPLRALATEPLGPSADLALRVDEQLWPVQPVLSAQDVVYALQRTDGPVLPWGAALSLEGTARDLAGNPLHITRGELLPDPGPWQTNADFEQPVGGWGLRGALTLGPLPLAQEAPAPFQGEGAAVFWGDGVLVAELDLPADADTLHFHWTLAGAQIPALAQLSLVTADGAAHPGWALDPATLGSCAGQPCAPWTPAQVDLSPLAGQRVFARFEVARAPGPLFIPAPPLPPLVFAVDAVSVTPASP